MRCKIITALLKPPLAINKENATHKYTHTHTHTHTTHTHTHTHTHKTLEASLFFMSNRWTPCGQYWFCIPQCISFNRLHLDSKWPSKPSCGILQASVWSIHLYIAHVLHSWWSSQSSRSRDSLTNVEARSPEGNSFIKDLLFYFHLIREHHALFSQFVQFNHSIQRHSFRLNTDLFWKHIFFK